MSHDPVRSCFQKDRYPNEQTANRYAAKHHEKFSVRFRSYFCHECGGYHLTTHKAEKTSVSLVRFAQSTARNAPGYLFADYKTGKVRWILTVPALVARGPEYWLGVMARHNWWTPDHEAKFKQLMRLEDEYVESVS